MILRVLNYKGLFINNGTTFLSDFKFSSDVVYGQTPKITYNKNIQD